MTEVRRGLALFATLFVAYLAALGLPTGGGPDASRYTQAEAHRLLTAESIVSDGDLDLRDEYALRRWSDWYPGTLRPTARLTNGRLHEPQGIGLPLLIAPAYALAGPTGVEIFLAAMFAAAFAVAAALGRRLVPDPWPTLAALTVGLSPPALAAATTIAPSTAGALLLAGAVVFALRVRDEPRMSSVLACAALAALAPWLAIGLAVPALIVVIALARWLYRRNRGLASFTALEILVTSGVFYVALNDRIFGGPVPDTARLGGLSKATGISSVGDVLSRVDRLAAVLIDRDVGALRWAPVLVLALWALWLLARSRRTRIAIAVTDRVDAEVAAALLGLVVGGGLLVAALGPVALHGSWMVPGALPVILPPAAALAAWGWRHAGRAAPVLAVLTLAGSTWFLAGVRLDEGTGAAPPQGAVPWGGAERVLPRF
ncbi:hypothetical protein [Paraconexibacter sp.]|uniref:hypothetical protein n=1 Tax=Paraconexibacter sp. TaxID=2949640 RepID=UPI003568E928